MGDHLTLNHITIPDCYSIPHIQDFSLSECQEPFLQTESCPSLPANIDGSEIHCRNHTLHRVWTNVDGLSLRNAAQPLQLSINQVYCRLAIVYTNTDNVHIANSVALIPRSTILARSKKKNQSIVNYPIT